MGLLDMPPEVFQHITQKYVAEVGLCEAWKHREVCKTFSIFITEEVFGRQPMGAYIPHLHCSKNFRLLWKGIAVFLEYCMRASYGAHDIVPDIIRNAVDRIMKITGNASSDVRAVYISKAITVIDKYVNQFNLKHSLITEPSDYDIASAADDSKDTLMLCLVAGMGDASLTRTILKHSTDLCKSTYCFGYPLEIAVRAGDISNVELFLGDIQRSDRGWASTILVPHISQLNSVAPKFSTRLIALHFSILGRPKDSDCRSWFRTTICIKDMDLLENILCMGLTQKLADTYRREYFRLQRLAGRVEIMKLLLRKGVFSTRKAFTIKSYGIHDESLLSYCVRIGDSDLVRVMLGTGAQPDGITKPDGWRECPIRLAVGNDKCNPEIVELLLAHGADSSMYDKDTLERARKNRAKKQEEQSKIPDD